MRYERPNTANEAASLLAQPSTTAHILAGGTDLLVKMQSDQFNADLIIDIKSIKGMRDIVEDENGFTIGAAVPCAALGEHEGLKTAWPGLVEAANLIGSNQIQSRCTLSGNLCNASPGADSVPALVAAGAKALVVGTEGERAIPVEDIPLAPGRTALKRDEFIRALHVPAPSPHSADAYLRFTPRTEMDIAVVGVAVALTRSADGRVSEARVCLGAVGPKVILATEAADLIIDTALEETVLESLAQHCANAASPIDDKRGTVAFRKHVAGVLAKRSALIAYERAGEK